MINFATQITTINNTFLKKYIFRNSILSNQWKLAVMYEYGRKHHSIVNVSLPLGNLRQIAAVKLFANKFCLAVRLFSISHINIDFNTYRSGLEL